MEKIIDYPINQFLNLCNQNLVNRLHDAPFLLRFLRTKKFSVPQACEMLERYLTIRQLYPQWFRNLDCEDPNLANIINSGYLVPLLERDNGRQIIFSCAGNFDPHKYTSADMVRVHSLVTEALMDDESNQINGYTYINDESGFQMAHISLWSLTDVRNILRCIQLRHNLELLSRCKGGCPSSSRLVIAICHLIMLASSFIHAS
ncbi:hypothetical protein NQ315_014231 [Exocentrus adspersus]|uniref:CRAL/TRIO N-terminal domain-containing protein n=1 Tax=Exocentrus adspersus TaxID=1586481 RepID=A0AAV8VC97_9CUCU|nr:hypothetical protein NQ315_014231 [Exocentrus adspersus]